MGSRTFILVDPAHFSNWAAQIETTDIRFNDDVIRLVND
jgi:hypothetical protein